MPPMADVSAGRAASLAGWFGQGLAAAPDGVALRAGGLDWTYAELYDYALRLGGALRAQDGHAPAAVGILAARSAECYAGILAALFAGATVVPMSPAFPVERTVTMARAAGVTHVIADRAGRMAAAGLRAALPDLHVIAPEAGRVPAGDPLPAPVEVDPAAVAYVLFTSGSTGQPKGVPVTHANMAHFLAYSRQRYRLTPSDACSQTFDTTFDLAMFDLFVTWSAGATLVSTPAHAFRALPDFVTAQRLTVWFSVPSAIALVGRYGGLAPGSMPSLRWSLFCGEPLLAAAAAEWQTAAPGSILENLYGPTELTIACSVYRWSPDRSPAECVNGVVPIGDIYPGLGDRLLAERESDVGVGELCVTGPQMFSGYLNPSHDEGRFLAADGQRWYRTGDLVRRTPAGLAFLGRLDHQVKIRGYRVELAEIEARLRELPAVAEALVVPVEHGGTRRLAAWYTGVPGCEGELRDHLAAGLPEFMVPHWLQHLRALPLNANGKADRRALAERAQRLADDGAA